MTTDQKSMTVPPKRANTDYPLIDSDPHLRRVFGYARPSDYAVGGGMAAASPLAFWAMERVDRFYGFTENSREVEMDMREMVGKVKTGEPLYGSSSVSSYLQGVAARNSRYSELFIHVLPWFNLVNHDQHGVDTAKYYQQAERELESEGSARPSST
ncbi:hypothetical protein FE257_002170 [Aspergillus nanangensis]|uniref:NADH-ubiquinone oxidoreductase 21kDa subunit C-terminal fungi domain-containing protein n=1 Tax=Aspergillus nanangensis TaxID=2582783 RepID=A0AAD4GY93_ASPNN|nr:hypothetical protein FE257_002170 [Aspergillus nanangensis]